MADRRRGRPRVKPWSTKEMEELRQQVRDLLAYLRWSAEELDEALGYNPGSCVARRYLTCRTPSRQFQRRFLAFAKDPPEPRPEWVPRVPRVLTGKAIPAFMVETGRRECLECLALQAEGQEVEQIHFFAGHPRQVVHSRCRDEWRRRRRWFHRCEELDCPYLAILNDGRIPICESQDGCDLRRKPWHEYE